MNIKSIYRQVTKPRPILFAILLSTIGFYINFYCLKEGNKLNTEAFIKVVGGIFVFFFGMIWKLKEEAKIEKELFDKFNARYDERFNDLLNTLARVQNSKNPENPENPEKLKVNNVEIEIKFNSEGIIITPEIKNLLIDYFNMCGEEYLWYKKGLISNDVWKEWLDGIKTHLKTKPVIDTLREDLGWGKTDSENNTQLCTKYYGLIKHLKTELDKKQPIAT